MLTIFRTEELRNASKLGKEVCTLCLESTPLGVFLRLPHLNAWFREKRRVYPLIHNRLPIEIAHGVNVVCGKWIPKKLRYAGLLHLEAVQQAI